MTDSRMPKPRALPAHLDPNRPAAEPRVDPGPPPPVVRPDLLKYMQFHFKELFFTPETTVEGRLWFNMGVRSIVKHLEILAEKQKATRTRKPEPPE